MAPPNQTQLEKTFLFTRPRLFSYLAQREIKATPTANPFNPDRAAWIIQLTPAIAEIIADFYKDIDHKIPDSIIEYRRIVWRDTKGQDQ